MNYWSINTLAKDDASVNLGCDHRNHKAVPPQARYQYEQLVEDVVDL